MQTFCPHCGAENIPGVDSCESCESPLTELSVRAPRSSVEADLLRDRLDKLRTRPHASVAPDATVGEVLRHMVETRVGCVTIVDRRGRLAGIFSERDALVRLNTNAQRRHADPIMKYMTPNPAVITATAKIAHALHMMDVGGHRHLPVIDEDERPVKLISIRDILAYLRERIAEGPARR